MIGDFDITWIDHKREPQNPPKAQFPRGIDLNLTNGSELACYSELPYPATRCGLYAIRCNVCGQSALVSTAGRPDDPRSITLPCGRKNH